MWNWPYHPKFVTESLAVVVLIWFCACEGFHNTDTFRLSVWALIHARVSVEAI